MGVLRQVVVLTCVCTLSMSAIVPTTYRPSTYLDRAGRDFRFIPRDTDSAANSVNSTYRLFGKTYYIQPDGSRRLVVDGLEGNTSNATESDIAVISNSNQSSTTEETPGILTTMASEAFVRNDPSSPSSNENESSSVWKSGHKVTSKPMKFREDSSEFLKRHRLTKPARDGDEPDTTFKTGYIVTTQPVSQPPEYWSYEQINNIENQNPRPDTIKEQTGNDASTAESSTEEMISGEEVTSEEADQSSAVTSSARLAGKRVNLGELLRTSERVVEARGVATALLDAAAIVYNCVRHNWGAGMVTCLSAQTATLLDATFSEAYEEEQGEDEDGEVQQKPKSGWLDESQTNDVGEGRKKGFKKVFGPMGLLLKLKFLLVLIGVAMLAGKAAVLTFGTFCMTLMMYMKKPPHGHVNEHVTVYPSPPFHHQKRYDDTGVVSAITGGRRLYM